MHRTRRLLSINTLLIVLLSACSGLVRCGGGPAPLDDAAMADRYATPLAAPQSALAVYHLGHSLVGRDMPAMIEQLAPDGHSHASQLGWGSSLRDHYEPDHEIHGFAEENDHPRHRPADAALASGDYDALVLTEMVEIRDAIRYHDSAAYLARWARRARQGNPDIRLYLYETWHNLDDAEGWLARVDADFPRHWEGEILRPALAREGLEQTAIYAIPAGQAMAAFVRRIEAAPDGIGGLRSRQDLFDDSIHLNDAGAYLVALVHYSVLYHRAPLGLPHDLVRADGSPASPLAPEAAQAMQQTVWDVVRAHPLTGLSER